MACSLAMVGDAFWERGDVVNIALDSAEVGFSESRKGAGGDDRANDDQKSCDGLQDGDSDGAISYRVWCGT